MAERAGDVLVYRFGYAHYQTDGKVENIAEAAAQAEADTLCLALNNGPAEALSPEEIAARLMRAAKVARELRRRGYGTELVLPGVLSIWPTRLLNRWYKLATAGGFTILWADDTWTASPVAADAPDAAAVFRRATSLGKLLAGAKKTRLGLIAADGDVYRKLGVNMSDVALRLAGQAAPLIAQSQTFAEDYDRVGVLRATAALAIAHTLVTAGQKDGTAMLRAAISQPASSFHKSAEAMQMQINAALLTGGAGALLDCFDDLGTAPGTENAYIAMNKNRSALTAKLAKWGRRASWGRPRGVNLVVADDAAVRPDDRARECAWAVLLWRLGIPVSFVAAGAAPRQGTDEACFIVPPGSMACLDAKQREYVFRQGVLLDAEAAAVLSPAERRRYGGVQVGRRIRGEVTEIFSDAVFTAPYYGHRSGLDGDMRFRLLAAAADGCRPFTTLLTNTARPNVPGAMRFDDVERQYRTVVLPYAFATPPRALLTPPRQRQLLDVLAWLMRLPLACFVENAPDLAPLWLPLRSGRQAVLALLNVGFDWAINARIRLHNPPLTVNRVRELSEDGKLRTIKDLGPHQHGAYRYIELDANTAVPPMQMTILLLET